MCQSNPHQKKAGDQAKKRSESLERKDKPISKVKKIGKLQSKKMGGNNSTNHESNKQDPAKRPSKQVEPRPQVKLTRNKNPKEKKVTRDERTATYPDWDKFLQVESIIGPKQRSLRMEGKKGRNKQKRVKGETESLLIRGRCHP